MLQLASTCRDTPNSHRQHSFHLPTFDLGHGKLTGVQSWLLIQDGTPIYEMCPIHCATLIDKAATLEVPSQHHAAANDPTC